MSCWDFKNGTPLQRGDKCRFSHVIQEDEARATRLFAEATTLRAKAKAKALKTPEPSMAGIARSTTVDLDDPDDSSIFLC